ncbi:MAG: heme exporter protein CcmD [Gammaproteobacteria bacterium]
MHSWHEFLTMGGYARYVWPAYGIALVVLAGSAWTARSGLKRALKRIARPEGER